MPKGLCSLKPGQPPQHPSGTQAGQFSVSVDVSVEVLGQSMGLPALGQSVVGVAAGAHCEAGCARIHSREPHVMCALAPSPILPKILVARSHASS